MNKPSTCPEQVFVDRYLPHCKPGRYLPRARLELSVEDTKSPLLHYPGLLYGACTKVPRLERSWVVFLCPLFFGFT